MDLSFFIAIFSNQDEPSLACEFDKQPRSNTSLTHILLIRVVARNYVPFILARSDYLKTLNLQFYHNS